MPNRVILLVVCCDIIFLWCSSDMFFLIISKFTPLGVQSMIIIIASNSNIDLKLSFYLCTFTNYRQLMLSYPILTKTSA